MHNIRTFLTNALILFVTAAITLTVATIAITRKVNEQNEHKMYYSRARVQKEEITAVSNTRGVITELRVRVGDEVERGDIIAIMDNNALREKVEVLNQYESNVSAQTEAQVINNELENLVVYAPADGVVGKVHVSEFDPVESFSKIATLYSNDSVNVLAHVSNNEFQALIRSTEVEVYSDRLNQSFPVSVARMRPYQETVEEHESQDVVGIYFTLTEAETGADLLHDEIVVILPWNNAPKQTRPADFYIQFWNGLLNPSNS